MRNIPFRVLVISAGSVPGSNGFFTSFSALSASIHTEIDVLAPKTEMLPHQSRSGSSRIFRVPSEATEHPVHALCRAVGRQLEGHDYDVIHTFDPLSAKVAHEHSQRIIYEPILECAPISEAWWSAHDQAILHSDLVITSSRVMFNDIRREDAVLVPPCVSVAPFPRPLHASTSLRGLFLGELSSHRDIDTLVEAIGRSQSRHPSLRIMVAGESNATRREYLRQKLLDHALDTIVRVRGEPELSALPRLCGACDFAVVSAAPDARLAQRGFIPQPLLSLIAGGLPVVVASIPTTQELLSEQQVLFYQPNDPTSLSSQINRLTDPDLRDRLGQAGRTHAVEHFQLARRTEVYRQVYSTVLPQTQALDAWDDAFPREETQNFSGLEEHADTAVRTPRAPIDEEDWDPQTKRVDRPIVSHAEMEEEDLPDEPTQ